MMVQPLECSWAGVFPAATTQFDAQLRVDLAGTLAVQGALLRDGVHGLVVLGTVGENNSLSASEKRALLEASVDAVGGRVPVIADISEFTTDAAVGFAHDAERVGAGGLMVLPPMVYVPTPAELEQHFKAVAAATSLPIMLYNNPPAYRVCIDLDTLHRLAEVPNIVAVKESSPDPRRFTDIINRCGERFVLFAGLDDIAFEGLLLGARGWVSGLTNAFPVESLALYAAVRAGDLEPCAAHLPPVHAAAASGCRARPRAIHQAGRGHDGPRHGICACTAPATGRRAPRAGRFDGRACQGQPAGSKLGPPGSSMHGGGAVSLIATDLIRSAVVWDNHACMPLRAEDGFLPQLSRHKQSGHTVVSLNVGYDAMSFESNVRVIAHFRHWIRRHADEYMLIERAADVHEAKRSGRLGICFDLEGAAALGDQLSMVELFYDLGVRWMLMAYNKKNSVGGGCLEAGGLTGLGRSVLDEMRRVGMVPCCSHTSWETAQEVIAYVDGPVIFSHSNAHAVHANPRNIPDHLAKACAASGGVVGVVGYGPFIGSRADGTVDNSTAGLFRHLDHFVQLVGPEHVGLGIDYVFDIEEVLQYYSAHPDVLPASAGYSAEVAGAMTEPERLPALVQTMIDHQYPQEAIVQILGGNHLRVAEACWR